MKYLQLISDTNIKSRLLLLAVGTYIITQGDFTRFKMPVLLLPIQDFLLYTVVQEERIRLPICQIMVTLY